MVSQSPSVRSSRYARSSLRQSVRCDRMVLTSSCIASRRGTRGLGPYSAVTRSCIQCRSADRSCAGRSALSGAASVVVARPFGGRGVVGGVHALVLALVLGGNVAALPLGGGGVGGVGARGCSLVGGVVGHAFRVARGGP